jgi:hypothetical protein
MGSLIKRRVDPLEQGVPVENEDNEHFEKYSKAAIQLRMRQLSRTARLKPIIPESEEVALLPAAIRKSKRKRGKLSDCVLDDDDDVSVPVFVNAAANNQTEQSSSEQSHTLDRSGQQTNGDHDPINVSDDASNGSSDNEEEDRNHLVYETDNPDESDYPLEPLMRNNNGGSQEHAQLIDLDELRDRHGLAEGDENYLARDRNSVYRDMSGKYMGKEPQRKKH